MFACIFAPQLSAELSLTEFAYGFSPIVEEVRAGTVVIDVDGCELDRQLGEQRGELPPAASKIENVIPRTSCLANFSGGPLVPQPLDGPCAVGEGLVGFAVQRLEKVGLERCVGRRDDHAPVIGR